MSLAGSCALVTGSSRGLGAQLARELAARGCGHLVLVARDAAQLQAVSEELRSAHGTEVTCLAADLTAPDACTDLVQELRGRGIEVNILINNAGVGLYGPYLDSAWARVQCMIALDVLALLQLTHLLAADMRARGDGYILQVASIAAHQPAPLYAAYSGAKSFVLSFGEALADELRGTGVSCTVLCPGVTRTSFFDAADQRELTLYQRLTMMETDEAARMGISAMLARRVVAIPGLLNRLSLVMTRLFPRRWTTAVAGKLLAAPNGG